MLESLKRSIYEEICSGCNGSEVAYEDTEHGLFFCSTECQQQYYHCSHIHSRNTPWGINRIKFYTAILIKNTDVLLKYLLLSECIPIYDIRVQIIDHIYTGPLRFYLAPKLVDGTLLNVIFTGRNNLLTNTNQSEDTKMVYPSTPDSFFRTLFINRSQILAIDNQFVKPGQPLPGFTVATSKAVGRAMRVDYDALKEKNYLRSIGNNTMYGAMGFGDTMRDFLTDWTNVPIETEPYDVACGLKHALMIDTKGVLWSTGSNDQHQLGFRLAQGTALFVRVDTDRPCILIGCGNFYSVYVTIDGELWITGKYDSDMRYTIVYKDISDVFTRMEGLPPVCQLSCASTHCAVVTIDGQLWVMGFNNEGQMGVNYPYQVKFTCVTGLPLVVSVYCHHLYTIVTCKDGSHWASGSNANGVLGLDRTIVRTEKFIRINHLPALNLIPNDRKKPRHL